jgi:hypothetical protein
MNLPPGKTCKDCMSFQKCIRLFGCIATNDNCDWSPSRFEGWPSESAREFFTKPRPELQPVSASNSHAVLIDENARLRAELAEANRKGRDLCNQNGNLICNVLRLGSAWSLLSVLEELEWAARHLLGEFNYDAHGHERIKDAVEASKEIRAALVPAPTRAEEWDGVMKRAHEPVKCAKCGVKIGIAAVLGVKFCPKCCKPKEVKP